LKTGHHLVRLFGGIDDSFRQALEDAYVANPVIRGKATLREALAEYDTLFVKACDSFEDGQYGGDANMMGLIRLLDLRGRPWSHLK
jgi:hypothetical protein